MTKKIVRNQARQGDVLVVRIGEPPKGAEPKQLDPRGAVLAEGELTGHHHRIVDHRACLLRAEGTAYDLLSIEGLAPVSLQHEEHAVVHIGGGTFEVRKQTEWDWSENLARRVQD
jgi:hypothetical protein